MHNVEQVLLLPLVEDSALLWSLLISTKLFMITLRHRYGSDSVLRDQSHLLFKVTILYDCSYSCLCNWSLSQARKFQKTSLVHLVSLLNHFHPSSLIWLLKVPETSGIEHGRGKIRGTLVIKITKMIRKTSFYANKRGVRNGNVFC